MTQVRFVPNPPFAPVRQELIITLVTINETITTNEIVGYNANAVFGLCHGDNVQIKTIYDNEAVLWEKGSPQTIPFIFNGVNLNSTFEHRTGANNQLPMTIYAGGAQSLSGIAYVGFTAYRVDEKSPALTLEIERLQIH